MKRAGTKQEWEREQTEKHLKIWNVESVDEKE